MSSAAQVSRTLGTDGRSMELRGTVGFASLPDQLVNKSVSKGFDFNILCVGETAIGKSTLIDSLFKANFDDTPVSHKQPNVSLTRHTYDLKESNVNLKLTIVSTTGYGDQINKENSFQPIVEYIDNQFEIYLQEELKIKRNLVETHDTRIHVCLYFISPTGHSLKSLDLVCMKELDKKVNIIPIIAKADTVSRQELLQFKKKIMEELGENGLRIYTFPTEDATVAEINNKMNEQIPFAVVGSREEIVAGGQRIRARKYPWGVVEVENETHCDFVKLREMIIRTNMEDLREKTHSIHYELYRRNKLTAMGFSDMSADNRPVSLQETYEQKRSEHLKDMHAREERMRQMFVQKVKDKEAQLKASEQKLHDEFERMRKQHGDEKKQLDDKRNQLEDEISDFNKRKMQLQAQRAQAEISKSANQTLRSPRK